MKRFTKHSLCDLLTKTDKLIFGDVHRCETCSVMCISVWDGDELYEYLAMYEPDKQMIVVVSLNIGEVVVKVMDKGFVFYNDSSEVTETNDEFKKKFREVLDNMKSLWEAGK